MATDELADSKQQTAERTGRRVLICVPEICLLTPTRSLLLPVLIPLRGPCLHFLRSLMLLVLCLGAGTPSQAQQCPDPVPQTSGSHSFRQQGESFEIPIILADCHPVALELRWANGRNNGTNLQVTFLDSADQPIQRRSISAFVNGSVQFPFATMENQRWVRAGSVMMSVTSVSSIPKSVRIEAVWPFALPATVSYRVTRVAGRRAEEVDNAAGKDSGCDCAEGKANGKW